jgi:Ser/Thr protein kinase RdoA (MazF antagonist)
METTFVTKEVLRNWEIGDVLAIEPIDSYWGKTSLVNTFDSTCYILKEKSDLDKTQREATLLFDLSEVGAPVAAPVRTIDGMWYARIQNKIFCLYPKLAGEVITEHYGGNSLARAEMFGKAIGFLHTCFLQCSPINDYEDIRLLEQVRDWAIPCVCEHTGGSEGNSIRKIWQEFEQEINSIDAELPAQLIHRDLHPANMLFDKGEVSGFLDFEMVMIGPRIFDLCYCGTSLLVSAFPETEKMRLWPALFA